MVVVDYMTRVVITLGAMVYPGYQSYKAFKKSDKDNQESWLKYWLVLSVISGLMLIIEPILYDRVPFFPAIKIAVVVFLIHPKTKGYCKIFDVIGPQLEKHEAMIDDSFDKAYKAGQDHVSKVGPQVQQMVQKTRDTVNKTLNKKTT